MKNINPRDVNHLMELKTVQKKKQEKGLYQLAVPYVVVGVRQRVVQPVDVVNSLHRSGTKIDRVTSLRPIGLIWSLKYMNYCCYEVRERVK